MSSQNSITPVIEGATIDNLQEYGSLLVRVFTANQALPVPDATVIVSQTNDDPAGTETQLFNLQTDRDGITPEVTLQAPPASLSLVPNNSIPYALYNVKVNYPGFYTFLAENVQLFANNVSILPVQLTPLPVNSNMQGGSTTQTFDIPPHILTQGASNASQAEASRSYQPPTQPPIQSINQLTEQLATQPETQSIFQSATQTVWQETSQSLNKEVE